MPRLSARGMAHLSADALLAQVAWRTERAARRSMLGGVDDQQCRGEGTRFKSGAMSSGEAAPMTLHTAPKTQALEATTPGPCLLSPHCPHPLLLSLPRA